jgi:protein-tyrosine-phosphatase
MAPTRVLFLCPRNDARSIMAEAFLRHLGGARFMAYSAGGEPSGRVHCLAYAALRERGIALDFLQAKGPEDLPALPFDVVVTLCEGARPLGARFPTALHLHWAVADPCGGRVTDQETLAAFRAVRDELLVRVAALADARADLASLTARWATVPLAGRAYGGAIG